MTPCRVLQSAGMTLCVLALSCSSIGFHVRSGDRSAGETRETIPSVKRPPGGILAELGSERVDTLLLEPWRARYEAQYGPRGLTPYIAPSARPHEALGLGDAELELKGWLNRIGVHTLVLLGQDIMGSEGLVANFAHELASQPKGQGSQPAPLVLELCQLLSPQERGKPISRLELAARALERLTGARPDPARIEVDLRANTLLLVVADFDRLAEWVGPSGAFQAFEGLRTGPGKLLMVARPIWFQAPQRDELELMGAPAADRTATSLGEARIPDTLWLVLLPLSDEKLAQALETLTPGKSRKARLAHHQILRDMARYPALTSLVLDVAGDSLLLEDVLASPDLFHLYEKWSRWKLEALLGEGRLSLVSIVEAALTHLAGRIYRTGRLRLQPTGAEEKALLEANISQAICAPNALLFCGESGYSFRQGRWLDYYSARSLLRPLEAASNASAETLIKILDGRRPGAGAMALFAAGLASVPGAEQAMHDVLTRATGLRTSPGVPSANPPSSFVLEALVRLRLLRQGLVDADGRLRSQDSEALEPAPADGRAVQEFWRQAYREEEQRIREVTNHQLDNFLSTSEGRLYSRLSPSRPILRSTDGQLWAYIPSGRAIIGSYFTPEEDPVRLIDVVRPFLLSVHLIENKSVLEFVRKGGYSPHPPWISAQWAQYLAEWKHQGDTPVMYAEGYADYPVINVSSLDARAYAKWQEAEDGVPASLPSADEWEYAARGLMGRLYPWGDVFDAARCNTQEGGRWQTSSSSLYAGKGESPFGTLDMAGNVWEWTSSLFTRGPEGDFSGARILTGGGWRSGAADVRASRRLPGVPDGRYDVVGFRLKREIRTPPATD